MKDKDGYIYEGTPTLQVQREYIILEAFEDIKRFKTAIDKECDIYNKKRQKKYGATKQIPIYGLSSNLLTQYLQKKFGDASIYQTNVRKILEIFERKGAIQKMNKRDEIERTDVEQLRKELNDSTISNKVFGKVNKYEIGDKYNEVMLEIVHKLDEQLDFDIDSYDAVSPERAVQLMLTSKQMQKIINLLNKENQTALDNGGQEKINEHLRNLQGI